MLASLDLDQTPAVSSVQTRSHANQAFEISIACGERETAVGFGATVKSELGWTSVEVPQRGDVHSIG